MKPAAWLVLALLGCDTTPGDTLPPPPVLTRLEPTLVLPATTLRLEAPALLPSSRYDLVLTGTLDGAPWTQRVPTEPLGPTTLAARLPPNSPATFVGAAQLTQPGAAPRGPSLSVTFERVDTLTPTLQPLPPTTAHLGDTLVVHGTHLLHPAEGTVSARLTGTRDDGDGPVPFALELDGFTLGQLRPVFTPAPLADPATPLDRARFGLNLTPALFGLHPTRFEGTLTLINRHHGGPALPSAPVPLTLTQAPSALTALTPTRASQGMWLEAQGRGLLPANDLERTATLLVLDGVFHPRRGEPLDLSGPRALHITPEDLTATQLLTVLAPHDDHGLPLGATAGRFIGHVSPLLLAGDHAAHGQGLDLTLEILNPHQAVHLQVLPAFDEALARFGLLSERAAILARILEVAHRDYAGLNLSVSLDAPAAFAAYTLIELGGPDPNQAGLFGLDNTAGKDVGNHRLDDVIGGLAIGPDGQLGAYGGVFAAELLNLSPQRSDAPLASPRFDDIFADFAPELGGHPAAPGERDGPRGPLIREAVRVLGNLIGSTITHELGHALGLTALTGLVHNEGDTANALMDAGIFRPFEERAELDGQGPSALEPFNRLYLESILPLDTPTESHTTP